MRLFPIVLSCLFLLAGCTTTYSRIGTSHQPRSNAEIVQIVLQKGLGGDEAVINKYVAQDYKQHNPMAEDGRAGLLAFVRSLKGVEFKINIVRVLTDDDYVAVHSDVWFGDSHSAVIDLFIVRDGMLREHWDCIYGIDLKASGHNSMTGGTIDINARDNTGVNRKLMEDFVRDVLINRRFDYVSKYVNERAIVRHGNSAGNMLQGVFDPQGVGPLSRVRILKVHRVIVDGDFVLMQSEGEFASKRIASYDLFRIADGKCVEYWFTTQEVPPISKNKNGMF